LKSQLSSQSIKTTGRPRSDNKKELAFLEPWKYTLAEVKPVEFSVRAVLLAVLTVWGWMLIGTDFRITTGLFPEISFYEPVIGAVTLVFHEAGHVLFMPFGQFMAVLGGSLFQLMVPAGLTLGFVYYYKNTFAGAVTLWWLGFSFMDLGPYIYDARDMQLMLLGGGRGHEIGGHDWNNLLTWTDSLQYHETLATVADTTGEILVILSVVWGTYLLVRQFSRLRER